MKIKFLQHRNSKIYLVINILQNLWFVEAVWYFFFINFVSYFEIGLIFAISTFIGILAEIPTGIFADKYGRKKAVVWGCLILTLGWGLMATTNGFSQFLIGAILSSIGRAFVSGALDAVVYDSLPINDRDDVFEKLITFGEQITTILFSITVLVGGFLYTYYFRLPHLLFTFSNLLACIFSLFLVEKVVKKSSFENIENPLGNNLIGFKELKHKKIKPFLLTSLAILAFFFLYDWGFSKPTIALNAGFLVEGQAVIFAVLSFVNVFAIRMLPKMRKRFSDAKGLLLICLVMGFGFILGSLKLGYYGIIALVLIEMSGYVGKPWISLALNKHISAEYRATTLSTLEFISKIPYVFTNIVLGGLLDSGKSNIFHFSIGAFMLIIAIAAVRKAKAS